MSKLNCDYCKNIYNENNNLPLILPCNHTICKSCLNSHKNKNIFYCKKCNKNVIISKHNLKPNNKILNYLQFQLQDKSNNNQSELSSKEENEEEEDQEEEGEEEQDEENEEGEEEEDDIDQTDEIVEEKSENENDHTETNENIKRNNISKIRNNDKRKTSKNDITNKNHIRKSILKKQSTHIAKNKDDDSSDNNNYNNQIMNKSKSRKTTYEKNNDFKRNKAKHKTHLSSKIATSRVNFTSEGSSQDNQSNSESNDEESEKEESLNEEEENDSKSNNSRKNNSIEKSKKSSRKGTDYIPSNRNSQNLKKDYKIKKEEENETNPSLEGNDFCIKHKDKQIEFFCSDCSCAICSLCIYETHNGHKLSLLDDITGIIKKKMGDFFIRIQDIIKINKDNKFNWQKRKDEVNEYQKQQINIVIKSFKEISNKLEEKKNVIIKEFKNKYNHEFNRFDQIKMAIDNDGKEMEKINNLIDNKIKSFNIYSDAKILKNIEKYKKIFKQTGLDCGKLQKNEIAIKTELSIDPAMKPITVNINGLIELLNKVEAKNICYPKVIGIFKDENDNTSLNQQKSLGKNEYNLRVSQSGGLIGMNNYMNNPYENNLNNYKGIKDKKYINESDNVYNNRQGLNQSNLPNIKNIYTTSNKNNFFENLPPYNIKFRNLNSGNKISNNNLNRLNQIELNDSNYGEYGPPNHSRGKFLRQLEMTPTATFSNVKRSSKFGTFKDSHNSFVNLQSNNNYMNGKNYNGNNKEMQSGGIGILKENGFGSRGSEYSNHNNNTYTVQNNYLKVQKNNSFGSLNDNNNNDSILQRKNMLVLKERNPSAGLPLKMKEENTFILPKISPFPQNNQNSSNNNKDSKRNINNSDSEQSNKKIEDSIYFFGEADYCLKFYLQKKEWELIPYKSQLSRQIGLLRYSGLCSLPSYRIILSGGCKKETDEPSNLFLLINSKNINDVKSLKNLPKKKYHHGCIFLNNDIYIIGGYDHYDRSNSIPSTLKNVERYNLSKKQWQNLNGLNEARACFGQCIFNGQIFVFGGLYNGSTLESIERYDEESNIWSLYHISFPMKLAKAGIVNLDNQNIYVIGGIDENLVPVNYVFKCKLNSDYDKNVWNKEPDLICPRATGNNCFLWKMNIFVFGGSSTNYFEKFDLNNKNWETIENFFSIIKSSNTEMILTNYSCVLNKFLAFP